jgi:hypothetical protein
MSERQASSETTFDGALLLSRRWLLALTCAIGTARYFDACLAAVRLRAALDQARRLAGLESDRAKPCATHRLRGVRAIAAPMLALVPAPRRSPRPDL